MYKYMTSISKNVYSKNVKSDDIVNKYNNKYHSAIKRKPIDVRSSTYIDSSKTNNNKILNLKLVIWLEYQNIKNIFAKGYVPNCSEEVFLIKIVKNTVPWIYIISDLKGEEIVGTFSEKELQQTNQKEFRIEKVIKRKGNKLYVKYKGHDSSFNSLKL